MSNRFFLSSFDDFFEDCPTKVFLLVKMYNIPSRMSFTRIKEQRWICHSREEVKLIYDNVKYYSNLVYKRADRLSRILGTFDRCCILHMRISINFCIRDRCTDNITLHFSIGGADRPNMSMRVRLYKWTCFTLTDDTNVSRWLNYIDDKITDRA